ncbi:alcohol dehydrogenase catalytic domain-containing protein [Photobacterium phosphoreum]|uniref:alcohol dehydrogenase catalytic domain-containing protein n=1 Tax=Photobacterium phosphoreum TaxID=659 RepID=UPI0039B0C7B0
MKAAVAHEFKQKLVIEDVKIPSIGVNDVLVNIKACGVCHTDIHACQGDWPVKPKMPLIPGHEGVGIVITARRKKSFVLIVFTLDIMWMAVMPITVKLMPVIL